MPTFSLTVPAGFEIQRVDKFLSGSDVVVRECGNSNRSHLKTVVTGILVNGNSAKFSTKIRGGDTILVEWEENIPQDIAPQDIPLDIVYEDDNVTVVNKAQGMVTHPAAGNWDGTLVNALLFHWGCSPVKFSAHRPGIVHRLDKDTSGLIITAKNPLAEKWLQRQFQERLVKKEYIAIVCGRPPERTGSIKTQIVRDPKNRKRFKAVTDTDGGKFAHTVYRCVASYGAFSLVRLRLKTGRTHQIRVHMKYIGCPILGDPIYGNKSMLFPDATLMLHSRLLGIRLPDSNQLKEFKADVPVRFKAVLRVLHKKYPKSVT